VQDLQAFGSEAVVPVVDAVDQKVKEGAHLQSQLWAGGDRVDIKDLSFHEERDDDQVELGEAAGQDFRMLLLACLFFNPPENTSISASFNLEHQSIFLCSLLHHPLLHQ